MKIIRTQLNGFVMYEFVYRGQNLLHWDLELLLKDVLFFFGVDLSKHFFNANLN